MIRSIVGIIVWAAGPLAGGNPPVPGPRQPHDSTRFAAQVHEMLNRGRHPALRWPNLADVRAVAESAYRKNGWRPLWIRDGRPTAAAHALIASLGAAADRGLEPADYDAPTLAAAAGRLDDEAGFDLALTTATTRLTSSLHEGRLNPRAVFPGWRAGPARLDWVALLDSLRHTAEPGRVLDRIEPQSPEYQRLKQWLARYRILAQSPHSPLPSIRTAVAPGSPYRAAGQLRQLLQSVGDLAPAATVPAADTIYDQELANAIRRFQRRHGLSIDGVIGRATLAQLNRPFSERVRQIELALERRRWWPEPAPPIVVNVPAFRLTADHVEMKVIAGVARKDETPVFTAELGRVVFQPYWEVPITIMREEIRPRALRNPAYLEREGMELLRAEQVVPPTRQNIGQIGFGIRVRQRPGPRNALGRVKFLLKSDYAVHLHDTPSPGLFTSTRRDFSHGCIRISDPLALARYLLSSLPDWTEQRIDTAMLADTSVTVELPKPIPVAVIYETAVVMGSEIEFRPDIYDRDRNLERLLAAGYPYRERLR